MINKMIWEKKKSHKNRFLLGIVGMLFILQTNPVFCACLTGDTEKENPAQVSSDKMPCHGTMLVKPCHSGNSDPRPDSSDPGADTCPLCNCQIVGAGCDQKKHTLVSSGPVSPNLSLLVNSTLDLQKGLLVYDRHSSWGRPQPNLQSYPLFILKSSFLI